MNRIFIVCILLLTCVSFADAQSTSSYGKEFWFSSLKTEFNPWANSEAKLLLHINSDVQSNVSVEVPAIGWIINTTVTPGLTCVVHIPTNIATDHQNDTILQNGIHVISSEPVRLSLGSIHNHSSDVTAILPNKSIGSDYLISAYSGIVSTIGIKSEILIVSTEDNTEIEITPSANIFGGQHMAGVTYTKVMNEGDTYMILAENGADDFTGTIIRSAPSSGKCRPFSVFSGSECGLIPTICGACDILMYQSFPSQNWGKHFNIAPIKLGQNYSIANDSSAVRLLARDNNTIIDAGQLGVISLNAGEHHTFYDVDVPVTVSSDKPITVSHFMRGNCVFTDSGDPSMLILNPSNHILYSANTRIFKIQYQAGSWLSNFYLNIIVDVADISNVYVDGNLVVSSNFIVFPNDSSKAYTQIFVGLLESDHKITCSGGFIAYAYGKGDDESYYYSWGSYEDESNPISSLNWNCTNTPLTLFSPEALSPVSWYNSNDPTTILSNVNSLSLTAPSGLDTFFVSGISQLSSCLVNYPFVVDAYQPQALNFNSNGDTVCKYSKIELSLSDDDLDDYHIQWFPNQIIGANSSQDSIVHFQIYNSGWYGVYARSKSNPCQIFKDSVYIHVNEDTIVSLDVTSDKLGLCLPDTAQLTSTILQERLFDNFNFDNATNWSFISGGQLGIACGNIIDSAFIFNGSGIRSLETLPLDVSNGGRISLFAKAPGIYDSCDGPETGENLLVQYSIDLGINWITFDSLLENSFPNLMYFEASIPTLANSNSTQFRLKQPNHDGQGYDIWIIENILVSAYDASGLTFNWSNASSLSSGTALNPKAYPTISEQYILTSIGSQCAHTDSVSVTADTGFVMTVSNDTTLCFFTEIELNVITTNNSPNSTEWFHNGDTLFSSQSSIVFTPEFETDVVFVESSSGLGCTIGDSIIISVNNLSLGYSIPEGICSGDSVVLECYPSTTISDNFNNSIPNSNLWYLISNGAQSQDCGSVSGNALHFSNSAFRRITTNNFNVSGGGYINFDLKYGDSPTGVCQTAEPGENVFLEYSLDGLYFQIMPTGVLPIIPGWVHYSIPIPIQAQTPSTHFRWRQLGAEWDSDHWAIDNVSIDIYDTNTINFQWFDPTLNYIGPGTEINFPILLDGFYHVQFNDTLNGCLIKDSIYIKVGAPFTLSNISDTTICGDATIALEANTIPYDNYSYFWKSFLPQIIGTDSIFEPNIDQDVQFTVQVHSPSGCIRVDTVNISLLETPLSICGDVNVCAGDSVRLTASYVYEEDFESSTVNPNTIGYISGGVPSPYCGAQSGNALSFNGPGIYLLDRELVSNYYDFTHGGKIEFSIIFPNDSIYCDAAEPNEGVNIKLNTNPSSITLAYLNPSDYPSMTSVSVEIPPTPTAINHTISWIQENYDVFEGDNWAIDDIKICIYGSNNFNYSWYDDAGQLIGNQNSISDLAGNSAYYTYQISDSTFQCNVDDTIFISTEFFNVFAGYDTTVCSSNGFQLTGFTDVVSPDHMYWTQSFHLDDPFILNPVIQVDTSLQYVLNVEKNGCKIKDTILVNHVPSTYSFASINEMCFGDSLFYSLSGATNVSWAPNINIIGASTPNPIFTPNDDITYLVDYTDPNGCTYYNHPFHIDVKSLPPTNIIFALDSLCDYDTTTISCNLLFNPDIDYLWNTGDTTWFISGSPGVFSVEVTDLNGCSNNDTATLFSLPTPMVDLGNDQTLCEGDSINFDAGNVGATYFWNIGDTTQTITSSLDTIWVHVQLGTCFDSDTVLINPIPSTFTFPSINELCYGDSLSYSLSGATNVSWIPNVDILGANTPNPIFTTMNDITYYVNYTDPNGCAFLNHPFYIDVQDLPLVDIVFLIDTLCDYDTAAISCNTAANPDFDYEWNTGDTTWSINTGPGIYLVEVTDSIGCSNYDTDTLFSFPTPLVDLGNNLTLCKGDSISYDAGNEGSTYLWNNGDTTQITTSSQDTIWVHVQLGTCFDSDTVIVVYQNINTNAYLIDDTLIQANTTSGNTYQWVDCNANFSHIIGETNPTFVPINNGSYAVIENDGLCADTSNCITVSTIGIKENTIYSNSEFYVVPNPTTGEITLHFDKNTFLNIKMYDATGKLIYTLNNANSGDKISLSNFAPGIYYLREIEFNSNLKLVKY